MFAKRVAMVILAGPIKHWWDENWDTSEHWFYDDWRRAVNDTLVADGHYLVYRPHEAFKGAWTERAQCVNDAALRTVDVAIILTPPGVPSEGTDGEVLYATNNGALLVEAPPPRSRNEFPAATRRLLLELEALGVHQDVVEQEVVLESIGYRNTRTWLLVSLFQQYSGHVVRLHYTHSSGRMMAVDVSRPSVDDDNGWIWIQYLGDDTPGRISLNSLLKAEVLGRVAD